MAKLIFESKEIDIPAKFDLVAAALAENDQFEKAIDMADKAHKAAYKSGNRKLASEIFNRLKLYKAKKPCRETD